MTPSAIPIVKHSLTAFDSRQARELAGRALLATSAVEVHALLDPLAEAMHRAAVSRPGLDGEDFTGAAPKRPPAS
jgi:signal transduction protein with GAF and PtsI domain